MTKTIRIITQCRYCGSSKLTKFLSLGNQPLSNSFISQDNINQEQRYPLDIYVCESCFLVQLKVVISAKKIFNDYLYLSSSSGALKKHYAKLASYLTKRFKLKKKDLVVDIGCNDGILLHGYNSTLTRVGVEPSNVAKIAESSGLNIVKSFFTLQSARNILKKYGNAYIITATNVFAHVDDVKEFVEAVSILLKKKGVFVIEFPYLIDLIDKVFFDTIYHEHLNYISLTPLHPFIKKLGLEIFDVKRIDFGASGPAIRVFVGKPNMHPVQKSITDMLSKEKAWGVKRVAHYKTFAQKVEKIKKDVLKHIKQIKTSGARIAGYSAPAKGNTLLNYFEMSPRIIDFIAETNKLKQGLVTPGSHIPIVSEEDLLHTMPEYALLLSWNYLDFFLKKSDYVKKGGKFLVPLPLPHIAP